MGLQFVAGTVLPLLLIVIMFGLGLGLSVADLQRVIRYPRPVVIGLFCQTILLPLVAFGLCHLFRLDPVFAVGLMLLAASPGGPTSNLFSKLTHGDVALNLTLTAVNSGISPVTMPLIAGLAIQAFSGENQEIGFQNKKLIEIFFLVVIPVSIGIFVNHKRTGLARMLEKPVRTFSVVALMLIIVATAFKEWNTLTENFAQVGWAVLSFNILSLTAGYFVPRAFRISNEQSIAIAFEIGIHNGALALFVAISVLGSTAMAVPAAIYSILMYFTAGALSTYLNRRRVAGA